jgi:hypothetical protein
MFINVFWVSQGRKYLFVYQARKVHFFRPRLSSRRSRDLNRRGQKVLFGRGAHYIFLGDRTNYKAKDITGKITNSFCIYFFQINTFSNTYRLFDKKRLNP